MLCIHCNNEIESDDNFCWNCGKWTSKGYSALKDADASLFVGSAFKKTENLKFLVSMVCFTMFLFMIFVAVSGYDLFKPIIFYKRRLIIMCMVIIHQLLILKIFIVIKMLVLLMKLIV